MNEKSLFPEQDDLLIFAEEEKELIKKSDKTWKVLVVDDDEGVHQVTHLLLDHFEYEGNGLTLISAYSEAEAKEKLREHKDIAVVLLDVVMGNDESGLHLVQHIREELKNRMMRIVLRTGQPGQAPEKKVIINYDINDYKLKTELTADKIYVTMVAALRSYKDMKMLENHTRTLERTIDATAKLFIKRNIPEFIEDVGVQFKSVLIDELSQDETEISGMSLNILEDEYMVFSGLGEFLGKEGLLVSDFLSSDALELIREAHLGRTKKYDLHQFAGFLEDDKGPGTVFYIKLSRAFNEWDKSLIQIFSATIKAAYMNLNLSQDVESTQRELIYALGELAEARSKETGNHVKRVSEYSKLLGKIIGLDSQEIELLAIATPVHDIGKLTIPDAILNKPGPLDESEFEIIKTHTSAGNEILRNSNRIILKTAALIAYQHHEKWNGTGYPLGLQGDEIHLYGRIVALADVFDALGSNRVYKEAWPLEQIVQYIIEESGKQFDPFIVKLFIENLDKFIEIKNTF